jgi:hypothetical protein
MTAFTPALTNLLPTHYKTAWAMTNLVHLSSDLLHGVTQMDRRLLKIAWCGRQSGSCWLHFDRLKAQNGSQVSPIQLSVGYQSIGAYFILIYCPFHPTFESYRLASDHFFSTSGHLFLNTAGMYLTFESYRLDDGHPFSTYDRLLLNEGASTLLLESNIECGKPLT